MTSAGSAADAFVLDLGATRLRPVREADAQVLFPAIHARHDVLRWLCWDGPGTVADLEARYGSWRCGDPAEPVYIFAIADAATDEALGEATLRFDGHPTVGDLGFWLGESGQGQGHGTRAVELLLRAGFDRLGAAALTASVKDGNARSLAVLERAGFVRERAPGAGSRPDGIAWILSLTRRAFLRRRDRPDPAGAGIPD